jgi:hypothetical protein
MIYKTRISNILIVALVALSTLANAKTFTELSSTNFFSIQQSAKSDGAMNIKLILQSENRDAPKVPIELLIVINTDTIREFHSVPHLYSGAIKSLPVKTGDRVLVGIKIFQPNKKVVLENLKGDLFLIQKTEEIKKTNEQLELSTGVWLGEETQIFKIEVPRDTLQNLLIEVKTTPQFSEDSLHIQISYMMPNGAFGSKRIGLAINTDSTQSFKAQTVTHEFEKFFKPHGTYVFQVIVLNEGKYINGIRTFALKKM